jgi:hypothetical protein
MKLKVTRQELDECIAKSIAKIVKEYAFDDFDDFSDEDMLDSMLDDPELRATLNSKEGKKAKKAAKSQGEKEISSAEKDDRISDEEDTIDSFDDADFSEDDLDDEEPSTAQTDYRFLIQQFAENETEPLFRKCVDAGVPLNKLYRCVNGKVIRRVIDDINLEYMAKHPMVGNKLDPADAVNAQLYTSDEVDRGGLKFKMKGGVSREGVKKSRQDAEEHGEEFK